MKRIVTGILALLLLVPLTACDNDSGSSEKKADSAVSICADCGEEVWQWTGFCTKCGAPITQNDSDDGNGATDWHESDTILSYLKKTEDEPLIVYFIKNGNYAKDAEVNALYIIQNGKCRKFWGEHTLGELSKMTDSEIVEAYEESYQEGLRSAVTKWKAKNYTEWNSGKIKIYDPVYYDIQGVLLTDDSGNYVKSEILFFPVSGIGDSPYVIEYPQYTDTDDKFMNYYGTYEDESYRDIKFNVKYFNTGHGTVSDINQINDLYCISNGSIVTGTVYDSLYYGFKTADSQWTETTGILFFRHQDAYVLDITVDRLESKDVYYIDPTAKNMLSLSMQYYYDYYGSFVPIEEIVDFSVEVSEPEPEATEVMPTATMPTTLDILIRAIDEDDAPVKDVLFNVAFEDTVTQYTTDENGLVTITGYFLMNLMKWY